MMKKTGEDLAATYTDPEWRRRYLTLVGIVTLLRHCIIPASFKIPDRMNSAITLTEYGAATQKALTTKHDVPAKEARLMCLLEIAHDEPMVDLTKSNLETIVDEISSLVKKELIRYPFIYGGHLYRRAAEIFPDRRTHLNTDETVELLQGLPAGVFQVGRLVVGPQGILKSAEGRWLPPTNRVPLQHCHDLTCRRPHSTFLSTDYDAAINQHLPKMSKVLTDTMVARGAWTDFTGILAEEADRPFDDFDMVGIPASLGDCLTNDELSILSNRMGIDVPELDNAHLRAHLLQELWTMADVDILSNVDFLISSGDIKLASHEVRRSPLVDISVGSFGLRVELGSHGLRLKPDDPEVPLLRLRRLITHLYDFQSPTDESELKWQLRAIDGVGVDDRLEEYLRVTPPASAIGTLVLARRQNLHKAMDELKVEASGVSFGDLGPASDDATLINKLMWKLGFALDLQPGQSAEFWTRYRESRQAVRDARASAVLDLQHLRHVVRELFIALEGLLADSIDFAWWAMLTDHLAAPRPFTYTPSQGEAAWTMLASQATIRPGSEKLRLGDREKRTLYPLGQSFTVLGALLETRDSQRSDYERSSEEMPKWATKTDLKDFHFIHTIPFLDLTQSAREAIIQTVHNVSRTLKESNVHGVRNQVSHFQRSSSNLDEVEQAIIASGNAIEALEAIGFVRAEYRASKVERDEWDRSVVFMRSKGGDEVTFTRPSRVGLIGLPGLHSPQYLMRAAVFSEPREILRFRVGFDSPFSAMWEGYPQPRARRPGSLEQGRDTAADVARASHGVLPSS